VARFRRGPALPSWNFKFQWVIAFLRQDSLEAMRWSYPALRHDFDSRRYPAHSLRRVTRRAETLGGRPALRFVPPDAGRGVVLFLHGGGYVFGSIATTHAEMAAGLAERSGREVIGIDYRLAPEHPYPAALEDALAAFDALVESGVSPEQIVVAGDSAGGNLALCLQLRLRDRGGPQARALLLISPWLDLLARSDSCRRGDALDYGHTSFLMRFARDFAGGVALGDARVSPLAAELRGLEPLCLLLGGAERLYDEGVEFAAKARAAGVAVELFIAADMPHNPPVLVDFHPHAGSSFARAARYAAERLDAAPAAHSR
jgi:acetyl esterase/lipase